MRPDTQNPTETQQTPDDPQENSSGLARAAGINSLGNVASRALGLVREAVISGTFGASGQTSAFDAVSSVPKMVYELLVGGMLSAALVPILSEYAAKDEEDLGDVLSTLLTWGLAILVVVVALLELTAPWVTRLLVGGFDDELLRTATMLVRIIVPAILIYGLSGLLQAYHYARQDFVYPAMGAPAHNLGVILAVVLLAGKLDIASLSVGILVAATLQFAVQLPGMRHLRLRWRLDWRHPVLKRILVLYAPVLLSIVVQNIGIIIDRRLASSTVSEAITWMAKATYLIQLPLGLVSMAISLAVLPTLSQIDARQEMDRFRGTLSTGLKLVLFLIVPAAVALYALGQPIIALIFEHGAFTAQDTLATWRALRFYLIGLPFSAIDLPLVFAFYSQKNTITPVIVGVIGVVAYVAVAPVLAFVFDLGYLGLVIGNAVQLTLHAVIMLIVFRRHFQGLRGFGIASALGKALLASIPLAALAWGSHRLMQPWLPAGIIGEAMGVCVAAALGGMAYVGMAKLLKLRELDQLLAPLIKKVSSWEGDSMW